jgi:histidinol-phosphatase (PHP family)
MSDYHLHLHPHRPVDGAPPMGTYPPGHIDRFVEVALSRGVTEVGFTEHLYRCVESEAALGRWWERDADPALRAEFAEWISAERNLSLETYVEAVVDAKARGLPVKLGLEADFVPGTEEAVLELLAPYPFDYLVGSIHWIGAWNFMREAGVPEFERRGARVVFEQYFDLERALAESGMVDVLAHADVIERHRIRPSGDLGYLYEPVVTAAARSGTAVEVSSVGLRLKSGQIFPAPAFLALFHAAGVPITLASDAHTAEIAAWGCDQVVAAATAAGYTEYLRFDRRERIPTELPTLEATAHHRP